MVEMSSSQQQYLTAKFEDFIATVHPGEAGQPARKPYQWQIRLMLYVVEHGRWPQSIGAPTASGKTSVIDIHVFLNAMAGIASVAGSEVAQELGGLPLQRIPRRLVLTVNRRSLVDDQFEEADMLRDRLQSDDHSDDGLRLYRRGLDLRSAVDDGLAQENKSLRMITAELRGGISPNREWRYYPQTCAVICATPDMFGSRLLFRGYGTSRTMRSMEAGLLAYDTVLIADEAHLSRQLLETACQVSRIENMAETPLSSQVTPLQVVETTATPASGNAEERVGVLESDFEVDTALARRLNNPKSVFTNFDFEKDKDVIDAIVAQCIALILSNIEADKSNDSNPHVLGCIVNTVKNAKVVAKELERQCKKHGISRPVDVYIGPMRAFDKCQIARKLHSLPYLKPDDAPCCIIGTQTLEVGVDVDFTDMVTEIAPGSALVQRSGRVNRRGLRSEGSVYAIFDPEGSDTSEDIFNQCDSSTLVTSYDSLNSGEPKVAEAFRRLQELEEGDFVNIDEKTERMQEDLRLLRMKAAGASFLAERTRGEAYSLVWYRREKPDVPYEDNKGRVIPHDVQWLVSSAQSDSLDSESNQEILSTRTTNRTLHLGGVPSGMGEPQRSDGHQNHVAQRAQALGSLIGLDPAIVEDLRIAGNFHDEGKKDERFQRMLRYGHQSSADAEPLAKSLFQSRSWEQRFRNTYQLRGWRHEQRSVAEFRFACETYIQLESMDEFDKQLVQRLIGTSHGHGRSTFHYGTAYLLPQAGGASRDANPKLNDISDRLFEMGEWETLVDRTSQRYGFWGISYLEALLRAADITCSKEGQ